jgi:hypothetical protein
LCAAYVPAAESPRIYGYSICAECVRHDDASARVEAVIVTGEERRAKLGLRLVKGGVA